MRELASKRRRLYVFPWSTHISYASRGAADVLIDAEGGVPPCAVCPAPAIRLWAGGPRSAASRVAANPFFACRLIQHLR